MRKPVPKLFDLAVHRFQGVIEKCVVAVCYTKGAQELLAELENLRNFFTAEIPRKILETIINTYSGANLEDSKQLTCFYLILLRDDIQTLVLTTEHSDFSVHEWNALFYTDYLNNLRNLVCGRNCTDHVLYLVGKKCSKLETFDGLSRCQPYYLGTTTDAGLLDLAKGCPLLRVLYINDPLLSYYLTPNGFRDLLRLLPTLEILAYNEIGNVVCNQMDDVEKLALKMVRQYNVTTENIRTILRLCPDLEQLHLENVESCDTGEEIIKELIDKKPNLTTLSLRSFHSYDLNRLCSTFRDLGQLELFETNHFLSCDHLKSIGNLRKLKQLNIQIYRSDISDSFKKSSFHSKLTSLTIRFGDTFSSKALQFCLALSTDTLDTLFIAVQDETEKVADYLIRNCDFPVLNSLTLAPSIVLTVNHIFDMMAKFERLTKLAGRCFENTKVLDTFICNNNLDFEFKAMNLMYYNGINVS